MYTHKLMYIYIYIHTHKKRLHLISFLTFYSHFHQLFSLVIFFLSFFFCNVSVYVSTQVSFCFEVKTDNVILNKF